MSIYITLNWMNSHLRALRSRSGLRFLGLWASALLVVAALSWGGEPVKNSDRVNAIKHEVARIDAEYQTTDNPDHYRLAKSLPHWELSGLIERGSLVYLQAIFTEGSAVREESYYLGDRRPILATVAQWLDLEDADKAARSRRELNFYIDGGQVVRRVWHGSVPSNHQRTDDVPAPSADLEKRVTVIARALAGELTGRDARDLLAAVPEAFSAIP